MIGGLLGSFRCSLHINLLGWAGTVDLLRTSGTVRLSLKSDPFFVDLPGDQLFSSVAEVDQPLGPGVTDDALNIWVHLVVVLAGLQVPLLLVGQVVGDVDSHHVSKLSLLLGREELSVDGSEGGLYDGEDGGEDLPHQLSGGTEHPSLR